MKRFSIRLLALAAMLVCSSAALAEQIDNPEYTQWSKYKPGTFIAIQQSTDMPGMANMPNMPPGMNMADMMPKTTLTTKLTEVKPDALTLEVSTSTTQMGRSSENKTTKVVPAKIDKPAVPATATAPATQPDIKEGKETLEVKGNKIDTTTREFTQSAAGGTSHIKIWNSPDVPGGMVKMESTTKTQQGDIKMTMTLVDYQVTK